MSPFATAREAREQHGDLQRRTSFTTCPPGRLDVDSLHSEASGDDVAGCSNLDLSPSR